MRTHLLRHFLPTFAAIGCNLLLAEAAVPTLPEHDWDGWFNARVAAHPGKHWIPLVQDIQTNGFAHASPVEGVRTAIEVTEGGRDMALLLAKRGAYRTDGRIYGQQVKITLTTPNGQPDGLILADEIVFDRDTKNGLARGHVLIDRSGDRIRGSVAIFSLVDRFVRVLSGAEITSPRLKLDLDLR